MTLRAERAIASHVAAEDPLPFIEGPNSALIDNLLIKWVGRRRSRDNDCIFDLVHRVEISTSEILRGMNQRIYFHGMREDVDGLTPLHVLALQGRIGLILPLDIKEPKTIGGRTIGHFFALAGHLGNRDSIQFLIQKTSFDFGSKDEYGGTEFNIAKLVEKKELRQMAGKYELSHTHIPAHELLKIWMGTSPKSEFASGLEACKYLASTLIRSTEKDSSFEIAEEEGIGFGVRATKNIAEGAKFLSYIGHYHPNPFKRNALQEENFMHFAPWLEEGFGIGSRESLDYMDGVVDASKYSSKMAHINDGLYPNVTFIQTMNEHGVPFSSVCAALRPIKAGEFLKVRYDSHPIRKSKMYYESEKDLAERVEVLKSISRTDSRALISSAWKEALLTWVSSPYAIFNDVMNERFSLAQLKGIFENITASPYINETYFYPESLSKILSLLKKEHIPIFIENWINPVLNNELLQRLPNPQVLYLGIAIACQKFLDCKNLKKRNDMRLIQLPWGDNEFVWR
jgi:hypothetical protein